MGIIYRETVSVLIRRKIFPGKEQLIRDCDVDHLVCLRLGVGCPHRVVLANKHINQALPFHCFGISKALLGDVGGRSRRGLHLRQSSFPTDIRQVLCYNPSYSSLLLSLPKNLTSSMSREGSKLVRLFSSTSAVPLGRISR